MDCKNVSLRRLWKMQVFQEIVLLDRMLQFSQRKVFKNSFTQPSVFFNALFQKARAHSHSQLCCCLFTELRFLLTIVLIKTRGFLLVHNFLVEQKQVKTLIIFYDFQQVTFLVKYRPVSRLLFVSEKNLADHFSYGKKVEKYVSNFCEVCCCHWCYRFYISFFLLFSLFFFLLVGISSVV